MIKSKSPQKPFDLKVTKRFEREKRDNVRIEATGVRLLHVNRIIVNGMLVKSIFDFLKGCLLPL